MFLRILFSVIFSKLIFTFSSLECEETPIDVDEISGVPGTLLIGKQEDNLAECVLEWEVRTKR